MVNAILDVLADAGILYWIEWFMRDPLSSGLCLGAWAVMSLAWAVAWWKLLELEGRRR